MATVDIFDYGGRENSPMPILTSIEQAAANVHFHPQSSYLQNSSGILPEKLFLKVEHPLVCMLLNHHSFLFLVRHLE